MDALPLWWNRVRKRNTKKEEREIQRTRKEKCKERGKRNSKNEEREMQRTRNEKYRERGKRDTKEEEREIQRTSVMGRRTICKTTFKTLVGRFPNPSREHYTFI
jgi:hypothetical protein